MKKGDDTNPGEERFYKLWLSPSFKQDILEARKNLGITEIGYREQKTREELWIKFKKTKILELLGEEIRIKEKYKIPTPYFDFIDDYIFFGKPMNALREKSPVALLSPTKELEEFYNEIYEPTAKLLIFESATQEKVIEFVKKNWREIELTLNKNIHDNKRVRKTLNKERNQLIRELWKKPIAELQGEVIGVSKNNDVPTTRERDSLVAKILVIRNITPKELRGGFIRKIAKQKK